LILAETICPLTSPRVKRISGSRIFVRHPKKPFATWGNSGIEPDKGKGISSPGMYEASLMWSRNDGERQWNTMSDWTYR
jgi:hypothetical protein